MRVFAIFFLCLGVGLATGCDESNVGDAAGGLTVPNSDGSSPVLGSDAASNSDAGATGTDASLGPIEAIDCLAPGAGQCDENSECGSEFYCDTCLRKCLKPRKVCEPCSATAQCELADQGSVCLPFASGGTHCGRACIGAAGCPKGYACVEVDGAAVKQCIPKTGDCAPASGSCKSDADCPFSTICAADYGKCLKGCTSDNECSAGKVCSLFRCVEPCATDSECIALSAQAKCVDKHCVVPGGCIGPADCVEKATYCDEQDNKCKPGCKTDFDCKEFGKKCEAGTCEKKGCAENWECAFGQVCDPKEGKCEVPLEPFCGACDAQDQEAKACGGKPARCVGLKDENDKEVGDFCFIPCKSAASGPCPQGYQCQDIKDQNGASQGAFCIRQCWVDPIGDAN
ncbi:MAG TPA: hypothetical protein DCQ06_06850 [Myxococcales bacterium]|nr:hypothetical protein [Myxococcales bacterium]